MRLKSGEPVFDRPNSHLHDESVEFSRALGQALTHVDSNGQDFIETEVDLGRIIGEMTCIETSSDDEIVYAQRKNRTGFTRFIKNREGEGCGSMVIVLKKSQRCEGYVLITAFVGHLSYPEPWDSRCVIDSELRQKSLDFWSKHALVWGSEEVIPGTETDQCPW